MNRREYKSPSIMCVQYIVGFHEYIGGYLEYVGGCSVRRKDVMIHVDIIRTRKGGGGCSVHRKNNMSTWRCIMIHVGEQIDAFDLY